MPGQLHAYVRSGFLQPSVMGPVGATNSASPNRLRERGQCRCCTIRSSASSGTSWSMSCSHVADPVSWHSPGSEPTRPASSPRPHSRPGSCSRYTNPVSNRTAVPPVHDMCMTVGSSSVNHRHAAAPRRCVLVVPTCATKSGTGGGVGWPRRLSWFRL